MRAGFTLKAPHWAILARLVAAPPTGTSRDRGGPGRVVASALGAHDDITLLVRQSLIQRHRRHGEEESSYVITHLGRKLHDERVKAGKL